MQDEQQETVFSGTEEKSVDENEWEAVQSNNTNDYELAFVNVDRDKEQLKLNIDGDEKPLSSNVFTGEFNGLKDISSSENPKPSFNYLVQNDDEERTYAVGKLSSLEGQLEKVDKGTSVKIEFLGIEKTDDGVPWFNFRVYTRK